MEHRFYNKSKKERNQIQAIIAFGALAIILLSIFISWKTGIYPVGILTFVIVLSIIAPFFDTPSLKKSGKLIYYSSLFIAERPKNGVIKIHGGTLFDYVFVLRKNRNGTQRTTLIMQQYLQGLLHLIDEYQNTDNPDFKIRGTSYIMNERTAERMGFEIIHTDIWQKLILLYSFFNILIANSIAKNRFSVPNLNDTKTYEADLKDLIDRRNHIEKLNDTLKNNMNNPV